MKFFITKPEPNPYENMKECEHIPGMFYTSERTKHDGIHYYGCKFSKPISFIDTKMNYWLVVYKPEEGIAVPYEEGSFCPGTYAYSHFKVPN